MTLHTTEYTISVVCRDCGESCEGCRMTYTQSSLGHSGLLSAGLNKRCPYDGLQDKSKRIVSVCSMFGSIHEMQTVDYRGKSFGNEEVSCRLEYVCDGCSDHCELTVWVEDDDGLKMPDKCIRRCQKN